MSSVSPTASSVIFPSARRRKNCGGVDDDVESAKGGYRITQRLRIGFAIANIDGHGDGGFFTADFLRFGSDCLRRFEIFVGDDHVSAALSREQHRFAPNSIRASDDKAHLAAQFFFRRLTANFRFFQCPILDSKSFRRR